MKRETFIKTAMFAAFIGFIFCLGASAARAQNVQPFVDCIERERDSSGALTGKYTAYYGYNNFGTTAVFIPTNSASNYFTPLRNPPNGPSTFLPGVHSRVLFVAGIDINHGETWRLTTYTITPSFAENKLCHSDNKSSRLITYQGKLSDGGAAANGTYDLQFQLFDAAGTARTGKISLKDVSVTNGVFTVQLDLGASSTTPTINNTYGQPLNQAILDGEDLAFEISVRAGNSSGAFTVLAPRQPLTAVPTAMRADSADNAIRAVNVSGGIVQLPLTKGTTGAPLSVCDATTYGQAQVDATNSKLYICTAGGWKSIGLQ